MDSRIKAYIDFPGFEAWDDIHSIIVHRGVSLWAAVIQIDPTFPRSSGSTGGMPAASKWRRFPSSELVVAAIKHVCQPQKKKTWLEKIGLTRPKKYVFIEKSSPWDNFFEREYKRPVVEKEIKLSTVSDKE